MPYCQDMLKVTCVKMIEIERIMKRSHVSYLKSNDLIILNAIEKINFATHKN